MSGSSNFAGALTVNGGTVAFPSSPTTAGPLGASTVVNLNAGGAEGVNAIDVPTSAPGEGPGGMQGGMQGGQIQGVAPIQGQIPALQGFGQ
jgi:hypothetical protein